MPEKLDWNDVDFVAMNVRHVRRTHLHRLRVMAAELGTTMENLIDEVLQAGMDSIGTVAHPKVVVRRG